MKRYFSPPLLVILALGFSSGLPLALTASTLSIWLTESGVSKAAIGLFAAVATPYAFKFMWAPLVDALPFPVLTRLLGRRRGWLVGVQLLLALAIFSLGFADPSINPWNTAFAALLVAICSATQDIVIDAFRVEYLKPEQQARGAAYATFGYRVAMLVSGAGALYLAEYWGWFAAYAVMGALVGVGVLATLLAREPEAAPAEAAPGNFVMRAVVAPFRDFMQHSGWLLILLFVLFYKFGDAFLGVMTNPFLVELGFTKPQIAQISKLFGFVATIAGGFAGAYAAERLGLIRALWICGILNAVSNLGFLWLSQVGADMTAYAIVNSIENFTGGMGGAVMVAYLSSLCNRRYTATQYALLSSLAAFARTLLSTPAGWAAQTIGWPGFFVLSTLFGLPGLVLLYVLTRHPANRANDCAGSRS